MRAPVAPAPPSPRLAAACALAAPALAIGGIALALSQAPWFDWYHNNLSDLGVGPTAPWFNGGLLLGGLAGLGFAWRLRADAPCPEARQGADILLASFACLALVGVFSIEQRIAHGLVAGGFFLLAPLGAARMGAGLLGADPRWGAFGIAVGSSALVGFLATLALLLGLGLKYALAEALHAALMTLWACALAVRMARA